MSTLTGYHHVALTVRDADATEDFYNRAFGFVKALEIPDEDGRGYKRILAHESGFFLGLCVHARGDKEPFSELNAGLDHLAFGVATREDLEAWKAKLDDAGIEHSEITETPVGDLLTVRDPDNIQIELWVPK